MNKDYSFIKDSDPATVLAVLKIDPLDPLSDDAGDLVIYGPETGSELIRALAATEDQDIALRLDLCIDGDLGRIQHTHVHADISYDGEPYALYFKFKLAVT